MCAFAPGSDNTTNSKMVETLLTSQTIVRGTLGAGTLHQAFTMVVLLVLTTTGKRIGVIITMMDVFGLRL
jgi:hypothetical protein